VKFWIDKPLAWNQLIAWTLLFASFIPLGFGVHFLRTRGKAVEKRESDPSLLAFEKTTQLVTSGIYKYIRHPLYCSLLLLTWGIFFKHITLTVVTLAVTATVFLVLTAKADEAECTRFFGSQYQDYMKRSKMFIPYVF
jgi:protein-S-isoprenylcysteine O-methyltransferase Ste14